MDQKNPFSFWTPLDLEKSIDDGSRRVCGIISTEDPDLDNEIISETDANYSPILGAMGKNLSAADLLDFERFDSRHGFLKYEHQVGECRACGANETANIIGVPTRIEKGVQYHDPITKAVKAGTGIWGELFKSGLKKAADDVWDLMQAIKKSGFNRRLGYSIEGAYLPASDGLPANVRKCLITNVVITTKPVNGMAWADMAKALTAGSGVTDPAQLEGGAALRRESLGVACNHIGPNGKFKSERDALEHMVKCKGKDLDTAKKAVVLAIRRAS